MRWPIFFKSKKENEENKLPDSEGQSTFAAPTTESSTCSRAYNDSCFWRSFTLNAVRVLEREEAFCSILPLWGGKICIKYGPAVQLLEAAALRLVAQTTSIPVPKVYCAFRHRNRTYIVMELIDREEIGENWAKRSNVEKQALLDQLKGIFEELRNIPHPRPGILAAADIQALYDPRAAKGELGFGPFGKESDFNNFLRGGMQADDDMLNKERCPWVTDEERAEMSKLISLHESSHHRVCFTHGDVSSSNILVKGAKVVGLIDFELSGFYPEYWEYTTAMNVNKFDGFWKDEIPKFLKEYPRELEMETLRRRHFGACGFRNIYPWG
ncbi:hypothetical protein EG329_004116 [Mollisiaceae sp. DMI_Dod_QoI]|nr:hypothetical protein EG329_004116 [Helotiales sp. DMI_Dod_QoI]